MPGPTRRVPYVCNILLDIEVKYIWEMVADALILEKQI